MNLGVAGVTYEDTPIHILNTVSVSDTKKLEIFARMQDELNASCVILSTCNRTEIYYASADPSVHEDVRELFASLFPAAAPYLSSRVGKDMLHYLFRVACGLQSLVAGEDQILGQIKAAHEFAAKQQAAGKVLNKVFLGAVTAAKKVKTSLNISGIPLSMSYIGIELLKERCGIAGRTALVIGAGKMSRLAAEYLLEYGAAEIIVCNRTPRAGLNGLDDARIRFDSFAARYDWINKADLVVSATSAPHEVVVPDRMAKRARPLVILDLALPFDVQPSVRSLDGVTLYNMETLKEISEKNRKKRERLCIQADGQLYILAEDLAEQLERLKVDPVIERLTQQCNIYTEECMSFILSKLPLSERESAIIEKAVASTLKKVVREPVRALKNLRVGEIDPYVEAAAYLFGITGIHETGSAPEIRRDVACKSQ